ncbi:MAG: response regulator transcription factor [Acidobacteria bacterium]|nr:response regulator transcription factor [Acidobacteriota bacterium]
MQVLIADDHALFRESLRSLLEAHDVQVVGEAGNGREAVEKAWLLKPQIVLMDLTMPEMDGLEATRRLAAELPEIKVVVLTASDDDAKLFEAIKSGAKGYLLKDLEAKRFLTLLQGVERGEPALSPALARRLLEEFSEGTRESRRDTRSPDALTDREQEVLELMGTGVTSNRKLAESLGVSQNTVKFHIRNILDKLHLHNRAEVVAFAFRQGLLDPEGEGG